MERARNGPQLVTDELTEVAKQDRPTVDAQGRNLAESIEGVIFERLAPLADHRGSLMPFLDVRDEFQKRPAAAPVEAGLSVLFVCEPIREHALAQFGDERHWGYTEEDALRYFLDHVDALPQPVARIVVRPHPSEAGGKYASVLREYGLPVRLSDGSGLVDEIATSHWVAGCNSVAMVVGLVAGKQVLCCIPPGGRPCLLPQPGIQHLQAILQTKAGHA